VRRAGAAAISVSIVLGLSQADASPQDLFGFGARSSAMGGSGPASSEGYEAVFGAPGLLAETREQTFTLGVQIARHDLHADTPSVHQTLPIDEMKTLFIGAALPIPFGGALKDRVTFGIGFLDPAQFLVRGKILYPERFQYPVVAPRVQSLAVMLGLGVHIGDRLWLGAGYEALAGVVGGIALAEDATGRTNARSDDQVIATYAPLASAAYDIDPHWRVGLTFRGELIGKFSIRITTQDLGIALPAFNVVGVAQYDPMQVHAEVAWSSIPHRGERGAMPIDASGWRVVLGVIGRRWSKYPGAVERTVLENPDFNPPDTNAHDTLSPRIGVERLVPLSSLGGLRLRAGYMFEPSPFPEQSKSAALPSGGTSTTNLLDNNRHVFTVGAGLVLSDAIPLQLDIFAQLHWLPTRTHTKDADVPADAPGFPEVKSYGTIWVMGMTLGVRF
jgi:long-chain fatty acid transport protein